MTESFPSAGIRGQPHNSTRAPRSYNPPPRRNPTVALCLGIYGDPMGLAVSYERGTPVGAMLAHALGYAGVCDQEHGSPLTQRTTRGVLVAENQTRRYPGSAPQQYTARLSLDHTAGRKQVTNREAQSAVAGEGGACSLVEVGGAY